ncbi:MAG TPA: ScpA family protein [Egibacteraceae bacterium]|jgi:segregation and condensation protein A|nr:ScpA family protein [Egibacteraceae bacterium]
MPDTFRVSVGSFEGPFDLLLQLIARHKVDIYEVSLAAITEDYLSVLRGMERVDLEVTTEFLVIAATLVELKAARLLPGDDEPELDDLALEMRDLLYARLLDYRTFKEAAVFLRDELAASAGYLPRQVVLEPELAGVHPDVDLSLTPEELAELAARALAEQPEPTVDLSHLQPVRMTVREAAGMVADELARAGGRASFAELTAGCRHRIEVVVCFLALLELYKLERVELLQTSSFGALTVEWVDDVDGLAGRDMVLGVVDAYQGEPEEGT